MKTDWIVLANASRARVLTRVNDSWRLVEIADLVHPQSRQKVSELRNERDGHTEKHSTPHGHAGTDYDPRTSVKDKEHQSFARQIGQHLDEAIEQGRCLSWSLIASNPFRGELTSQLSKAAEKALRRSIGHDFSSYEGPELERRVRDALSSPD